MRELNPIDLGGVFIPVDDNLLKVRFPTKGYDFLDLVYFEEYLQPRVIMDTNYQQLQVLPLRTQFKSSGEQILYENQRMRELLRAGKQRIEAMIKESENLYLFDEAAKVFPEKKTDK
jgi:hypothetical protein